MYYGSYPGFVSKNTMVLGPTCNSAYGPLVSHGRTNSKRPNSSVKSGPSSTQFGASSKSEPRRRSGKYHHHYSFGPGPNSQNCRRSSTHASASLNGRRGCFYWSLRRLVKTGLTGFRLNISSSYRSRPSRRPHYYSRKNGLQRRYYK